MDLLIPDKEDLNPPKCEYCNDLQRIEIEAYVCDESTGYNTITERTGRYKDCPFCVSHEDHETN
jgi:hypothetical protein